MSPRWRTLLAKALYSTGGFLHHHIKFYRPTYLLIDRDGTHYDPPLRQNRIWQGWIGGLKLVFKAEQIDRQHFAHWAYQHDRCTIRCGECGGMACSGAGCANPESGKGHA